MPFGRSTQAAEPAENVTDVRRMLHSLAALHARIKQLEADEQHASGIAPDNTIDASASSIESLVPTPASPAPPRAGLDRAAFVVEMCHFAAAGDVRRLRALLHGCSKAEVNFTDHDGMTPLHVAADHGRQPAAELLLSLGADPTLVDEAGRTPGDLALGGGHSAVYDLIMEHRARLDEAGDDADSYEKEEPENAPFESPCTPSSGMLGYVLIMVGLPARGKSFVSTRIIRYFTWNGIACQLFNFGRHRRDLYGSYDRRSGGDKPDLVEGTARSIAGTAAKFARVSNGIAIIDGTNTAPQRRAHLHASLMGHGVPSDRIVFVEVMCDDPDAVQLNIQRSYEDQIAAGKFKDTPEERERFTQDYHDIVRHHERIYRPLSTQADAAFSFIKINRQLAKLTLNRVYGVLPTRLVYLLLNESHHRHKLFLCAAGEWDHLVRGRIGGNSKLTPSGMAYASALGEFIKKEIGDEPFMLMSSQQVRARQTSAPLVNMPNCVVKWIPTLDDLSYGDCDELSVADIKSSFPNTLRNVLADPYNNAWPNGESIKQLLEVRLEHHIGEILAVDRHLVIVANQHVVQALMLFFDTSVEPRPEKVTDAAYYVPLHNVVRLVPYGNKRQLDVLDLGVPAAAVSPLAAEGLAVSSALSEDGSATQRPVIGASPERTVISDAL